MSLESLVEAFARGAMGAILAAGGSRVPLAVQAPGAVPLEETADSGPPAIIQAELPTPGFDDPAEAPLGLPGFEGLPPVSSLKEIEAAIARIRNGHGIPAGFYDPNDADGSVPLS